MDEKQLARLKLVGLCIGLLFVVLLANNIYHSVSRSGKSKLVVRVVPGDAEVTLNNSSIKPGAYYVEPGTYTVSARKDGFKDFSRTVVVGKEPVSVGLVPEPVSEDAKAWLESNPTIQLERESIGGDNAILYGQQSQQSTPIVKNLPHTYLIDPYSIDYGPDKNRKDSGVMLIVSNSTAPGRYAAQQWIQEQGQSLSGVTIVYSDFINPLVGAEGRAE